MHLSEAHHLRKMVAGLCMVCGPLLLLVGVVVHPEMDSDEATQLAVVGDHLDQWYASHLILMISLVLAFPAVLGLMHMLRERQVALGHVGGGLALLGLVSFTAIVAIDGFVVWQMAAAGDQGEMTALFQRLTDTAGIVIPIYAVSFAFALGMICLAVGLYRARAVQSWMAACLAVGAVLDAVAGAAYLGWLAIVAAAVLFVGFGSIGRMVLSESDEDWEHTPEYGGFRPLMGTR
jgi:hypothetical protein